MNDRQTAKIALERILLLFNLAEEIFPSDPTRGQRYIDLARKIAMRTRLHLPRSLRQRVCSRCNSFLVPSITSRIRLRQRREPHIAITCLKCGAIKRFPLRRRSM